MTPTLKLAQITAWSFSRKADYDKCPLLAKFKHVDRLKEPANVYMEKGTRVHEDAALYVQAKVQAPVLPIALTRFKEEFIQLRREHPICEQQWAFDRQWLSCSWFGPEAWLRIVMDAHYLKTVKQKTQRRTSVVVIDYKTGKLHPEHEQQRSLYALGAMLMYPDAEEVAVQHWYLDAGELQASVFPAAALEGLKTLWL